MKTCNMDQSTKKVSYRDTCIESIDFTNIKRKLMKDHPDGKGWSLSQADESEKWYKRYLYVILKNPDFPVVPNLPIDTFWHQHILDTKKYAGDCNRIFGHFLHHYPYFGMNGDKKEFKAAFENTKLEYIKYFDEDCIFTTFEASSIGSHCKKGCGAGCQQK